MSGVMIPAIRFASPTPRCLSSAAFMPARMAASCGCCAWAMESASPSVYRVTTGTGATITGPGTTAGADWGAGRVGGWAAAAPAAVNHRPPAYRNRRAAGRRSSGGMAVLGGVRPGVPACRIESAAGRVPRDPRGRVPRAGRAGRFAADGVYRLCRAGG